MISDLRECIGELSERLATKRCCVEKHDTTEDSDVHVNQYVFALSRDADATRSTEDAQKQTAQLEEIEEQSPELMRHCTEQNQ